MPEVHNPIRRWGLQILGSVIALLALSGCMTGQPPSGEEYELSSLRVVFLDAPQIRAKWQEVTGKSALMMTPRLALETQRREEVVLGFYDFRTRTIYCPKMDFEVFGHELHHAVLGANVTYADGRSVPWLRGDTIVVRGGVRIGIVGVASELTPSVTMASNVADLRFAMPAPVINERARALRARGATVVIAVAHDGAFCDGRGGGSRYYYRVDNLRFQVSRTAYNALVEGLRYRLYFTPRSRTIVAIEPL